MTERSKSESRPKAKRATILLVPRHREATIRAVGKLLGPSPGVLVLSVRAEHCSSWVACGGQAGGGGRVGRPRWPSHGDDGSSPDAPSVVSNGYWGIPHYDVTLSEFPVDKISVGK